MAHFNRRGIKGKGEVLALKISGHCLLVLLNDKLDIG
jgi:hypothetical protein